MTGKNTGDIQSQGKMVVGPGSIHPNGGKYVIRKNIPLVTITREQLIKAFKNYVILDKEVKRIHKAARWEARRNVKINITDVIDLTTFTRQGNDARAYQYVAGHGVN